MGSGEVGVVEHVFTFVISINAQDSKRNTHASNNYMSITADSEA